MEERKWRKRREWKRSSEARWGKKECGECYREDQDVKKGRRWNVEVFLGNVQ